MLELLIAELVAFELTEEEAEMLELADEEEFSVAPVDSTSWNLFTVTLPPLTE
jgi:hypothetical protein